MSQMPAPDEQKRRVTATFDNLAPTYDRLHFLQTIARRLVETTGLHPSGRVLDIATGTGVVALYAAQMVGGGGRVVGVDLSPEMLARAGEKAAAAGLNQVTFQQGDAEHLDFPDASFDAVLCSSSLFFMPDMAAALREWRRVLVPDGKVGFSNFGTSFFQPLRQMFAARMNQHGFPTPPLPNSRLEDPAVCQQLLTDAGFTDVQIREEQLGYFATGIDERWSDIESGLEGLMLQKLAPEQREQIKAEHLAELQSLVTPDGIWTDVAALFSLGRASG
ncbi:MAG: methyltransferase domain-containing protein [Chloroflexota bacterium]